MTDLTTLADRLDAAEGPSRELDEAIAEALGWSRVPNPTSAGGLVGRWDRPDGTMSGMEGPPLWSWSIDAAMSLVPEGWAVTRWQIWPSEPSTLDLLETTRDGDQWVRRMPRLGKVEATAATPAFALASAALRARSSMETSDAD